MKQSDLTDGQQLHALICAQLARVSYDTYIKNYWGQAPNLPWAEQRRVDASWSIAVEELQRGIVLNMGATLPGPNLRALTDEGTQ